MGIGSGLPLCLAGIDISSQARLAKGRNALPRETSSPETSAAETEVESGGEYYDQTGAESRTETRKCRMELAKQMEVLDRRREVLKAQRRTRQQAGITQHVRKATVGSPGHSHGARAA